MLRVIGRRPVTAGLPAHTGHVAWLMRSQSARRYFVMSAVRRSSNNSGFSNKPKSAEEEDREEIERERRLREQFAQKVQQGVPNQQFGGGFGGGAAGAQGVPFNGFPAGMGNPAQMATSAQRMFRFFFYLTAFMFLMMMAPLANTGSAMYTLQGIAWWELPIATAANFLLLRVLYSRKEQNRLKTEFEMASKANPQLAFHDFMSQQYPQMFQGYRHSQPEVIATVAACLAGATDLKFAQTMTRAAGSARDPKASVDDVVDALRRDFPTLF